MKRVSTGAELEAALDKAGKVTEDAFVEILKKLTLTAFRELVLRSGTDTGYLRSNWAVTTGTPQEARLSNPYPSAKAQGRSPFINAPSPPNVSIKAGDIIVLYNNTEYAIHLETGTPDMSAQPMIAPTYRIIKSLADRISKQLSDKKLNI